MTSRERFRRIMAFERTDRLPLIEVESYDVPTLERWQREGLPADRTVAEHLGLDTLEPLCLDFWPLPRAERQVLAEDESYLTVRDELGIVTKSSKRQPAIVYKHLEHPIRCRRDWEALKERLDPFTRERVDEIEARQFSANRIHEKYADCVLMLRKDYLQSREAIRKEIFALEAEAGGSGADLARLQQEGIEPSQKLKEVFSQRAQMTRRTKK